MFRRTVTRQGAAVGRQRRLRVPRHTFAGAALLAALISLGAGSTVALASSGLSGLRSGRFSSIPVSEIPSSVVYQDATCPSSENCYAVASKSGQGIVTRTADGGTSWTTSTVPGSGQLDAISCPTSSMCYVGGSLSASGASDPQIFVTTDAGSSWTADSVPAGVAIGSISCASPSTCIAVGQQGTALTSSVIATRDSGSHWVSETPPSTDLTTVRCVDLTHCWVAGPGAWFTANQGATWRNEAPPQPGPQPTPPPGGGLYFENVAYSETIDIEFTSDSDGWVVGGDQCGGQGATQCAGVAYHTTDGGSSWTISSSSQHLPFGWQIACQGVDCLMVDQGFSFSLIVDTNNDGGSWTTLQRLPTLINALACSPDRSLCIAAGGNDSGGALLVLGARSTSPTTPPRTGSAGGASRVTVNSISSGLVTPGKALSNPGSDLLAALITVLAVIFITFPAQLFNYTLKENYEEVRKWWQGPLLWLRRRGLGGSHAGQPSRDLITFAAVVLVGAVLDGFLDPSFGFNARSGVTLASMILALLVSILAPSLAAYGYRRLRHRPHEFRLHGLPAGLVVALVSVVLSRVTDFQPGYLYGLVCGVAFATQMSAREEGHVAGVSSLTTMAVAVVAWLIWIPVHAGAILPGAAAWRVLLSDLLAAVFVGGLVGNVVGMLPLNFLQGGTLARWHKGAWAAVYAVTTFGLIQILLRPVSSGTRHSSAPLVTVLLLFFGFGGASVAFYLYFEHKQRSREPRAGTAAKSATNRPRLWEQFLVGIGRKPDRSAAPTTAPVKAPSAD